MWRKSPSRYEVVTGKSKNVGEIPVPTRRSERGSVNMRIETVLRICNTLHVTPDEILTEENPSLTARQEELWARLNACPPKERETALGLLEVYLKSVPSGDV
jgi:hypothetical protein